MCSIRFFFLLSPPFSVPQVLRTEKEKGTLCHESLLSARELLSDLSILFQEFYFTISLFVFLNVSRIKILSFKRLYTRFQYNEIKIYYNLLGQNAMYMMQNVKLITINTYIPSVEI